MKVSVEKGQIGFFTNNTFLEQPSMKIQKTKEVKKKVIGPNSIENIVSMFKDSCKFIIKGKYGVMIHLKNKAMFYDFQGNLKSELNSSFIPHKALGAILVDNIGYEKMLESTVLDNKVIKVANKSAEMDIKFTKGQAVKVCLGDKERAGEVWRLQSNGCISVYFKDTNSIGAYPRKFIKKL